MANYQSPGVYVEEVAGEIKTIAGVGTSTGAFVGIAQKGIIGKAKLITSWMQFVREFGWFVEGHYLAYAVSGFFAEGGSSCYVVRTCHYEAAKSKAIAAAVTLLDESGQKSMRITAASEGSWGNQLYVKVQAASKGDGFKISVLQKTDNQDEEEVLEVFDKLTMSNVEDVIRYQSKFIKVEKDSWEEEGGKVDGSGKMPKIDTGAGAEKIPFYKEELQGGDDGLASLAYTDLVGDPAIQNGLHAFDLVDDINIVAIPDAAKDATILAQVTTEALIYCKNRKDCFYIVDPPAKQDFDGIKEFKKGFSSTFGALYYPWVIVSDPLKPNNKITIPPSGVVAGTLAHTDSARGVHKAPAGVIEGRLDSVLGVEAIITQGEQAKLDPEGINVIRLRPEGICIWGARTLVTKPGEVSEWQYINVRRLLLYIEESIDQGTQWVVFEPNTPSLWGIVKRNLVAFLTGVWRDGALFGSSPEEAFFVKVDAENNPQEVIDAGQLIIEVGVAPVKPAEFIFIRISQKTVSQ